MQHVQKRAKERFNVELSIEDLARLKWLICHNKLPRLEDQSPSRAVYQSVLNGYLVNLVWDKNVKEVITVLRPNLKGRRAYMNRMLRKYGRKKLNKSGQLYRAL